MNILSEEIRRVFRTRLVTARAAALANAEDFVDIVQALEALGQILTHESRNGFGAYKKSLVDLASLSDLAQLRQSGGLDPSVGQLIEFVREARNDAVHVGVFARRVVSHAIDLALIMEDALMPDGDAKDFMVRNPVCAELWQPLSQVRREMLEYSFSFLPVFIEKANAWKVISDSTLARYLRSGDRKARLAETLETALGTTQGQLLLDEALICGPSDSMRELAPRISPLPLLVTVQSSTLLGIITAFDVL